MRNMQSDLKVHDRVLLQQRKTCKKTTTYEHDPYKIVNINGSQVILRSDEGVCYKRNSSHVRKFEDSGSQVERENDRSNLYEDSKNVNIDRTDREPMVDSSSMKEPRRSSRSNKGKAPERLDL